MDRLWIGLGALAGLTAVAMAAAASHALPARLDPAGLRAIDSAVQMQGWHALALVACGLLVPRLRLFAHAAGAIFAVGLIVFCGAVYALELGQMHLGPAAPVGGTLLMAGWAVLGLGAVLTRG